jgi:hypothetical protein
MMHVIQACLRSAACAVALGVAVVSTSGCGGFEVTGEYPVGYYDGYPPDAYIATTEPVYFEGHAAYWYGGYWYYRDGGRWGHYDHEPAGLYARRMHGGAGRHSYEPSRGGGGGHGRSGGRGGGRR